MALKMINHDAIFMQVQVDDLSSLLRKMRYQIGNGNAELVKKSIEEIESVLNDAIRTFESIDNHKSLL